jgi:hypothetical protein
MNKYWQSPLQSMCGWTLELFNNNILPMTFEQERLRKEFQAWLAKLFIIGERELSFLTVCDRFPRANFNDLVRVYDDFHRNGFLEEVHDRACHDECESCDLSDVGEEEYYEMQR